jgi:hypothetical protein
MAAADSCREMPGLMGSIDMVLVLVGQSVWLSEPPVVHQGCVRHYETTSRFWR